MLCFCLQGAQDPLEVGGERVLGMGAGGGGEKQNNNLGSRKQWEEVEAAEKATRSSQVEGTTLEGPH